VAGIDLNLSAEVTEEFTLRKIQRELIPDSAVLSAFLTQYFLGVK
jgi:hypothetical protein